VFTTTAVVPAGPGQPLTVAITEYVPAARDVTLPIPVFCADAVNPLGPLHVYEAPAIVLALRVRLSPVHTGVLLDAAGAAGVGLTVTLTVDEELPHPLTVLVTE